MNSPSTSVQQQLQAKSSSQFWPLVARVTTDRNHKGATQEQLSSRSPETPEALRGLKQS